MVTIETIRKVLDYVNMLFSITTNISFKDENENASVDSGVDDNGAANAVEAKVVNGYAKQEATDDVSLPPTAKYSETWIHLRPDLLR
ncbi:hypothetical protein MAM1_0079c04471 [Mucor ambiguus]|uniref:Uncharacterized protein n=1 Tax=Mucor ambiguus TaxID=91626 RepID=A0A0C9MSF1_9FUNG|nr:hypothetical protein MAM1_0079c04471 [Mucor ambiguus]